MRYLFTIISIFCCVALSAQTTFIPRIVTVAQLSGFSVSTDGLYAVVTDGSDKTDCTLGGGTANVWCSWDGAAWTANDADTAEVNDLSSVVTWANVPDANIAASSVTQHEAALTITESQVSDLVHTVDTNTNSDTECSGSTVYYDGDGNCDDLTGVYEPAGITESDISDLAHTELDRVWLSPGMFTVDDAGNVAVEDGNLNQTGLERIAYGAVGSERTARVTLIVPVNWRGEQLAWRYLWSGDGVDTVNSLQSKVYFRYANSGVNPDSGTSFISGGVVTTTHTTPTKTLGEVSQSAIAGTIGASALALNIVISRPNDSNTGELWFHGMEVWVE